MKLITPKFFAPLLAVGLAAGAHAADEPVTMNTVLATVNGTDITAGQLMILRIQLPEQYQSIPDDQLFNALLDQAINQQLFSDALSEPLPTIAIALALEERALRAGAALEELTSSAASPEAIEALYKETYSSAEPSREFKAAHILVGSEEEAREVIAELAAGGIFSDLARTRSTGPSGPNGGDLGWFGKGMMVPPFEEAVANLNPGEISAPVQTQFGWHVIQLTESRLSEAPALSEVEGDLIAELQERAIENRLAELSDAAQVTRSTLHDVDPAFLSDPSILKP